MLSLMTVNFLSFQSPIFPLFYISSVPRLFWLLLLSLSTSIYFALPDACETSSPSPDSPLHPHIPSHSHATSHKFTLPSDRRLYNWAAAGASRDRRNPAGDGSMAQTRRGGSVWAWVDETSLLWRYGCSFPCSAVGGADRMLLLNYVEIMCCLLFSFLF